MEQNPHKEHRQRLRAEFLQKGLEGKQDYQALELLLTYAIPLRDVNPVAHELISKFGSISAVFDASAEELKQVKYISENGAVLIKLIPQLAKLYNESKWSEKPILNNSSAVSGYLCAKFIGEINEIFYMLSLDSHCRLNAATKITEGTLDRSQVYVREIVSTALRTHAINIIIAHNHPSGIPAPSANDIVTTSIISEAVNTVGIGLLDHVIVSGEKTFSFRSNGMINSELSSKAAELVGEKKG